MVAGFARCSQIWMLILAAATLPAPRGGPAAEGEPGEAAPRPGDPVDLAPFGSPLGEEGAVGVEWENPCDVREARLVFAGTDPLPQAEQIRLEWWGVAWPSGGSGGWMRLDDPWNGEWVRARGTFAPGPGPRELSLALPPLSKEEWREAGDSRVPYRRTLKLRVTRDGAPLTGPLLGGVRLAVLGRSRWREALFDLEVRPGPEGEAGAWIEARRGHLLEVSSLPPPRSALVEGRRFRAEVPAGGSSGVRLRLLHTEGSERASGDLTLVTVRLGARPDSTGFSFLPRAVLAEGAVRLPSLGALVAPSDRDLSLANDPGPGPGAWPGTVRRRLADLPEMTRDAALEGIPRLEPPPWVPLGVPAARQEVVVGPLGDWSLWRGSLHTPGRDSERIPHRNDQLDCLLDTRPEPLFDGADRGNPVRRLREGWLPVIDVSWSSGPLHYEHSLLATFLSVPIGDEGPNGEELRGDETVVLLSKLTVRNPTPEPQTATVCLRYSHPAPLALRQDGVLLIDPPPSRPPAGLTAVRGHLPLERPLEGGVPAWSVEAAGTSQTSPIVRWQAVVEPGGSRELEFKTPYVELLENDEIERLKRIRFDEELPSVVGYWKDRRERGTLLEVPSPALNDLHAAHLWHVLVTTDRDPRTGLDNQCVGTFRYKVFANETVMVARALDLRGEHREAERYLETFFRHQGREPLTGRFTTARGVFHSAGDYTHGKYSMNHGFVLWGAAEHYLLTRDRAFLERVAPQLLEGAEFIISQRRMTPTGSGRQPPPGTPRPSAQGLAPAGALEDVVEFQHWFATDAYYHLGLKRLGEALAAAGHPQAERIAREAEEYRRDIERAAREAATRAAAVRLRDGSSVPYVPSRVGQLLDRSEGWIREALYSSLHLATAEVVHPLDPLITWMLDALEDRLFFSRESGYGVAEVEERWFQRGGVTLQPCLLDSPAVYLARDEVPAALRAFWNSYALSIYPDVQCLAEWAPDFGKGGGPLYKTSDEARFLTWLRQLLLFEEGDRLWLCRGVPREWLGDGKRIRLERAPTRFGEASLLITSAMERGWIEAFISLPSRNPPREAWLRLRHPRGKRPWRVFLEDEVLEPERLLGEDILLRPWPGDPGRPLRLRAEYRP